MTKIDLNKPFCWTKFGTEAGEPIETILKRKELERQANGGIFLWGIGNGLGPSLLELLKIEQKPQLLFSPMRAKAKAMDISPGPIWVWTHGEGIDGNPVELPRYSLVTSRYTTRGGRKKSHFALCCQLDTPIALSDHGTLNYGALRNLRSDGPVGYSQVTAVVSYDHDHQTGQTYQVAVAARLANPWFIRLTEGFEIGIRELDQFRDNLNAASGDLIHWKTYLDSLKRTSAARCEQTALF